MRHALSSFLRSVANFLNPPVGNDVRVSPEQLRNALADMFRDPKTLGLVFPHFEAPFLVQGGTDPNPGRIAKIKSIAGDVEETVTPIYEDATNKRIGIGTSSPSHPVHVQVTATADPVLMLEGTSQSHGLSLKVQHPNAVIGFALAGNTGHFLSSAVQDDAVIFAAAGKNLLFGFGSTEYMRLTGGGRLAIGTTNPSELVHAAGSQPDSVSGTGTAATQVLQITGGKGGNTSGGSGQTAGAGAAVNITGGAGGDAPSGSTNGNGGSIILQPGAAGSGEGDDGRAGSVIIGGTASKQVAGGAELISAREASNENRVTMWCGLNGDTNARFLFNFRGFLEWGPGGTGDQDVALFRNGAGGISVGNFYDSQGGSESRSTEAFRVNAPATLQSQDEGKEVFAVDTQNVAVRVARGLSGFADSESFRIVRAVKTTNATATTIATITLGTPRAYYIVVRVVGRKDSSNRAFFTKAALANREGGVAAVDGTTAAASVTAGSGSTWACNIIAPGSGNDVLVQVTGEAANVYCVATIEYQSVSTDS